MQPFRIASRCAVLAQRTAIAKLSPSSLAAATAVQFARRPNAVKAIITGSELRPLSLSSCLRESELASDLSANDERAPVTEEPDRRRQLFVRNMVFDVNEQSLKEYFEPYGEIDATFIVRDNRGLSRGYGFVTFKDPKSVQEAASRVDGAFWHGRRVGCIPRSLSSEPRSPRSQNRPKHDPSRCIYIGNIPYETTDTELNRLFRSLDNVVDVRVAVDRTTGWPRGFAHADFSDTESAQKAKEKLEGMAIGGRSLRIDFADPYEAARREQIREGKGSTESE